MMFAGTERAAIESWRRAAVAVRAAGRQMLTIPILYKDFSLYWRDVQTAEQFGAAGHVGSSRRGQLRERSRRRHGLQRRVGARSAWADHGARPPCAAAGRTGIESAQRLPRRRSDRAPGGESALRPVLPRHEPHLHAKLARFVENTGVSELNHIREVCTDGVFRSSVLAKNTAVVLSTGPQNFDLAVAQDFRVAIWGPSR